MRLVFRITVHPEQRPFLNRVFSDILIVNCLTAADQCPFAADRIAWRSVQFGRKIIVKIKKGRFSPHFDKMSKNYVLSV